MSKDLVRAARIAQRIATKHVLLLSPESVSDLMGYFAQGMRGSQKDTIGPEWGFDLAHRVIGEIREGLSEEDADTVLVAVAPQMGRFAGLVAAVAILQRRPELDSEE